MPQTSSGMEVETQGGINGGEEIKRLEEKVKSDPDNYENYVALVQALRKALKTGRLRDVRERMADKFPLPESLWMEWINDERLSTNKKNDYTGYMMDLFEKAVEDYISPKIWTAFAEFVAESKSTDYKSEDVYEKAIVEVGSHIPEGHVIWDSYRKYLSRTGADVCRIRNLYRKELSVPTAKMPETMSAYVTWERSTSKKPPDDKILKVYASAKQQLDKRASYEEKLTALGQTAPGMISPAKMQVWLDYLDFEMKNSKKKDYSRVKLTYERAIAEGFLSERLWKRYLAFIRAKLNDTDMLCEVYSRATRNCVWSSDLWIGHLRTLEMAKMTTEWNEVSQAAMKSTALPNEELIKVQLEVCDFWRRRLGIGGTEMDIADEKAAPLRMTFDCVSELLNSLPEAKAIQHDLYYRVLGYWADIEMRCFGNVEQSRIQWENLLKKNLQDLRVWRAFISQEKYLGSVEDARKLYKRAVIAIPTTHWELETFCGEWMRFERECGTLDSLYEAQRITDKRIEKFREAQTEAYQQQQQSQAYQQQQAQVERAKSAGVGTKRKREAEKQPGTKKMRHIEGSSTHGKAANEEKGVGIERKEWYMEEDTEREIDNTAFVLNLSFGTKDEQLKELFSPFGTVKSVRHIRDGKGKSKGYAYVEYEDSRSVDKAVSKLNLSTFNDRLIKVSRSAPPKAKDKTKKGKKGRQDIVTQEFSTAFIKFLPKLDGELRKVEPRMRKLLHKHFSPCGKIKGIRLTHDKKGKLKNFAYIEFESPDSVQGAIKLSGTHLPGTQSKRPLSVLKSCPPSKKKQILKKAPAVTKRSKGSIMLVPRALGKPKVKSLNRASAKSVAGSISKESTASNDKNGKGAKQFSNADFRSMLLGKK